MKMKVNKQVLVSYSYSTVFLSGNKG